MSFADRLPADIQARIAAHEIDETSVEPVEPPVARALDPETATLSCALCGGPIESTKNSYRRVRGWERRRAQGGTNAIVLREALDEWACNACIELARDGISRDQGTLV